MRKSQRNTNCHHCQSCSFSLSEHSSANIVSGHFCLLSWRSASTQQRKRQQTIVDFASTLPRYFADFSLIISWLFPDILLTLRLALSSAPPQINQEEKLLMKQALIEQSNVGSAFKPWLGQQGIYKHFDQNNSSSRDVSANLLCLGIWIYYCNNNNNNLSTYIFQLSFDLKMLAFVK